MRLPTPYRDEVDVTAQRLSHLAGVLDWRAAALVATPWVENVRRHPPPFWAMESLLREYPIASSEGLALMRLAEALLRVPDAATAIALTADQLSRADFSGAHDSALSRLSAAAITLSKKFLPDEAHPPGLLARLGARGVVAATLRAVQLLGRQFVLGQSIGEAMDEAHSARAKHPQLHYSYDMLGEGARTDEDALRYLESYRHAIQAIAEDSRSGDDTPERIDGISIKLSALHPRYEALQKERVMRELVPRVWQLCELAANAHLNLTIDAEEVDRLELSLDVFEALAERVAAEYPQWQGFGLALQAYQTRALDLVEHVIGIARRLRLRLMCRLVKGAYWDAEIKRAQELGLPHYPVFTHKHHSDVSYLACARALLAAPDAIYPQFATHNAGTIAAIVQMAARVPVGGAPHAPFELQRLHGMGEGVYREVMKSAPEVPVRVYAPVGQHKDLLAYLVRRLLENGANSSFINQLGDAHVPLAELLASPLHMTRTSGIVLPPALYGEARPNSRGLDLCVDGMAAPLLAAHLSTTVPAVADARPADIEHALADSRAAFRPWRQTSVQSRAAMLRDAAATLQDELPRFCALLVKEAFKTWGDAVAEVREAIDFLRYYALEAERLQQPIELPGPTGESNTLTLVGRGPWVCISPWNFPLAIFTGQVAAALATGNTVLAKPAEQTPAVALEMVKLLHLAGVPTEALQLLHGPGETVGAALVAAPGVAGVVFTGSTEVAKTIHRTLAAKEGPIVPLIAETGGINAMVVDSSALPEQVVDAVLQSAFRSAGQRCSALRLLCLHEAIAEPVVAMLRGAAAELLVGDPSLLSTDVGPLIDEDACQKVSHAVERLDATQRALLAPPPADTRANFLAPRAYEVDSIDSVRSAGEIFGPVLQILRWSGDATQLIERINALGYGLTLGLQTRIDSRAQALARTAHVGNVYVNRNTIGAVVGVQPFGGEGLSGTGPKAGGPHYLPRFCAEQTLTINTTAAGGNVALLAAGT
ncbi:MAG TPA: L-glutamate gamma-semialdehyde dehydrogenase [Variovorax sp.]|nr:L-glutamate gamma-semialdehyde dehydrogenase [Variovorax sp.]